MKEKDFVLYGDINIAENFGEQNMKICFMQMHIPNPRTNKRIAVAKQVGDVSVICVRRATQDIWEPVHTDVPHYTFPLDIPTSKEIVKRYFVGRRFSSLAYKKLLEIKPDVLYIGGLDMLCIACKYKRNHNCRIIYEVADLRECFIEIPRSLKSKLMRSILSCIEKTSFVEVDYLALTSMKFYDIYYRNLIDKSRVIFVPNTPDVSVFENYQHKRGGDFTVGFIGGIRYLKQMKMLVNATEIVGCKVLFAGAGGSDNDYKSITEYCSKKPHVTFTGKYDYIAQIADLYSLVDCVYAVYDANNPNVKIALPNKLYESVLCGLPIIVAKNTYLSEVVETLGIGCSVASESQSELVECIRSIMNPEKYTQIAECCRMSTEKLCNNEWEAKLIVTLEQCQ